MCKILFQVIEGGSGQGTTELKPQLPKSCPELATNELQVHPEIPRLV